MNEVRKQVMSQAHCGVWYVFNSLHDDNEVGTEFPIFGCDEKFKVLGVHGNNFSDRYSIGFCECGNDEFIYQFIKDGEEYELAICDAKKLKAIFVMDKIGEHSSFDVVWSEFKERYKQEINEIISRYCKLL